MSESAWTLIGFAVVMVIVIAGLSLVSQHYTLNIKSRTVGDGQHGTARWATKQEIHHTYHLVRYDPQAWRKGKDLPKVQGIIAGSVGRNPTPIEFKVRKKKICIHVERFPFQRNKSMKAIVDGDDIHCLMIGASGAGKTAYFLYPNLEYTCATGMSFLALDSKGDLARNYATIAKKYYGYKISIIDLRNPTRSDGDSLLTLINRYSDKARAEPDNLGYKAKAEKYAKILAKTIINQGGESGQFGENAYFYDAAEGALAAMTLLLSEFLPPKKGEADVRHIISVFKLTQDLLAPSQFNQEKNGFQALMDLLPPTHKARWLAGSALNASDQTMASVMSTILSRLNAFLDTEMEQILCFDNSIDAETFASERCAIFLILPEEDRTKNFMATLMIQNLSNELFAIADRNEGKLKNRVVFFCDEFGTMPPFDVMALFSAGRSRKLTMVPIIQSVAQLEDNYKKTGSEILIDNCQLTVAGGFTPQSETAESVSRALGNRTVLSGSVSRGKNDPSQSLQMMERPLMSPDELKSIPKGHFIVMKTGTHPMQTRLPLFLDWGITFDEPYQMPERANRKIAYANKEDLINSIMASRPGRGFYNTKREGVI